MEKISVIVPVYKVEKYLRRCVDSIINQTYPELEIILVDDGSPDNCGKICDEYAAKDSRIKVIHKENGGLSDARNAGIDVSTGDYISFVDSDDHIALDMYEKMYNAIKKEDADISICSVANIDESGSRISMSYESPVKDGVLTVKEVLTEKLQGRTYWYWIVMWNKLYKKSLFSEIRFPYGKLNEDAFVIGRLLALSNKLACVSEELYYYLRRSDSIMGSNKTVRNLDEIEALFNLITYIWESCRGNIYGLLEICMKRFYRICDKCWGQTGFKERYRELTSRYREIVRTVSLRTMSPKERIHIYLWYISPYYSKRISGSLKNRK